MCNFVQRFTICWTRFSFVGIPIFLCWDSDFPLLGFRLLCFVSGERAQTRGTPGDGNSHGKLDGGDQVTDNRHDDDDGDDEEEEGDED